MQHQYVDRATGHVHTEKIFADRLINLLYSSARENLPQVFRALTGRRVSSWLGDLNYDMTLGAQLSGGRHFV